MSILVQRTFWYNGPFSGPRGTPSGFFQPGGVVGEETELVRQGVNVHTQGGFEKGCQVEHQTGFAASFGQVGEADHVKDQGRGQ